MINFTSFKVIKSIKNIIYAYAPKNYKRDIKIIEELTNILEESRKFVYFCKKINLQLTSRKTKHIPLNYMITLSYSRNRITTSAQRRIQFIINRTNNEFKLVIGNNITSVGYIYEKELINVDYELIMEKIYNDIEYSTPYIKERVFLSEWKILKQEMINELSKKYNVECDYAIVRRALIIITHKINSLKTLEAKEFLLNYFKSEKLVLEFIEDIKDIYESKDVLEKLL